jgi:hypothetical protein
MDWRERYFLNEEKNTFDSNDIEALRLLLKPPIYECGNDCANTAYDDSWLTWLLETYGSVQAAAYAGCIMLAEDSGAEFSDGTTLPDLQGYWLRMAKLYRPSGGRCIHREDEILPKFRGLEALR